jgi:hypothetical protein
MCQDYAIDYIKSFKITKLKYNIRKVSEVLEVPKNSIQYPTNPSKGASGKFFKNPANHQIYFVPDTSVYTILPLMYPTSYDVAGVIAMALCGQLIENTPIKKVNLGEDLNSTINNIKTVIPVNSPTTK